MSEVDTEEVVRVRDKMRALLAKKAEKGGVIRFETLQPAFSRAYRRTF